MAYKFSFFTCEGFEDQIFFGLHDPEMKWNGFECPYFPVEVAKKIIDTQDIITCQDQELCYYEISDYPVGVIERHTDGVNFYNSLYFKGVEYLPIGIKNWVWQRVAVENIVEDIIENNLDNIFTIICQRVGLNFGDIDPSQSQSLEDIKRALFRLSVGFIERNTIG